MKSLRIAISFEELFIAYQYVLCCYMFDAIHTFLYTEAKVSLQDAIRTAQETIADPEKVQGRLTKDDKVQ